MDKKQQKLALAICDFLNLSIKNKTVKEDDVEGLETEAFGIDPHNETQRKELSIKPASLSSIFDVFLKTQSLKDNKPIEEPVVDKKKLAEDHKGLGNKFMAQKNYADAIDEYTKALELDPMNTVLYSNRAAAFSQNNQHEKAVADSQKAIELDPNFSKAYSRLGHAHFYLGQYEESVKAYEKGLALDPENALMKQSLAASKTKAKDLTAPSEPLTATTPKASGTSPAGGMPDLGSMLNNPGFMQMASQMMSNPQFAQMLNNPAISQMAQNLMQDPQALQNLMSNPDVANMASQFMNKPQ